MNTEEGEEEKVLQKMEFTTFIKLTFKSFHEIFRSMNYMQAVEK